MPRTTLAHAIVQSRLRRPAKRIKKSDVGFTSHPFQIHQSRAFPDIRNILFPRGFLDLPRNTGYSKECVIRFRQIEWLIFFHKRIPDFVQILNLLAIMPLRKMCLQCRWSSIRPRVPSCAAFTGVTDIAFKNTPSSPNCNTRGDSMCSWRALKRISRTVQYSKNIALRIKILNHLDDLSSWNERQASKVSNSFPNRQVSSIVDRASFRWAW